MERNVGELDRTVRIVLGALLGIAGLVAVAGYWAVGLAAGVVVLVVGGVLFVTGTTRKCPIYAGAGIDTAGDRE